MTVRVGKHFLENSRVVLYLRQLSAKSAVESKISPMFELGTMKRESMYFESAVLDILRCFRARAVRISLSGSAGASVGVTLIRKQPVSAISASVMREICPPSIFIFQTQSTAGEHKLLTCANDRKSLGAYAKSKMSLCDPFVTTP